MKFAWIQTEKASYPLTKLCRWLGVTPSGFYAWRQRPASTHAREDRRLKVLVQASFAESQQRYGSPRIHADLIEQDEQVSRKRVIRLMPGKRPEGAHPQTVHVDHDERSRPAGGRESPRPAVRSRRTESALGRGHDEFVIGSSGKLYLAVVLDLFSRFVVGWAVSAVNDRHLTIKALEMALKRRCPEIGLLHHSDQGCTGEFKWSSQHLESEELRWEQESVDELIVRDALRCGRPVVHRWGGGSIGRDSGRRLRGGCRAGMLGWWRVCRRRSARGGSARMAW